MAPESGIIASAVILPPDTEVPAPSKRRQSPTADSVSKRPRLSSDGDAGSPSALRESPQPTSNSKNDSRDRGRDSTQDRRKTSVQEEKKRGQRLFGGLLSTLSQSTPNGHQKRRQEVEKRQQERARQQKAAEEKRQKEILANLKTVRRAEQIKFSEQTMRTRHINHLAMANFLSTKTKPKLYYKPWEMLPAQEGTIKRQITDAEMAIEREVEAFYERYPSARPQPTPETSTKGEEKSNVASEETVGEPQVEPESLSVSNINDAPIVDTTNSPVQAAQVPQPDVPIESEKSKTGDTRTAHEQEEHNGEVVLENEEDTVIY